MIRILKCKQPPENQEAVEDIIQKPVEWKKYSLLRYQKNGLFWDYICSNRSSITSSCLKINGLPVFESFESFHFNTTHMNK